MDAHGDTGSGRAPAPLRALVVDDEAPLVRLSAATWHARASRSRPPATASAPSSWPGPELLDRVFERFYRVDPARTHTPTTGGSGIGLTITAIVHAHGGHIRAHSQGLGHGARFVITLLPPAATDRAQDAGQHPRA